MITLALVFTSCHKDGEFSPKKKISRVASGTDVSEYTWSKDLLTSQQIYEEGRLTENIFFKYDNKKRVSEVSNGSGTVIKFEYDGSEFKEILLFRNGTLAIGITMTYKGKHIAEMKYYGYNLKSEERLMRAALQFVVSDFMAERMVKQLMEASAEKATPLITIKFTWDGDNAIEERTLYNDGSWECYNYTFDKKNNPFYGYCTGLNYNLSKNNPTSVRISDSDGFAVNATMEYVYDGKWPTRRIMKLSTGSSATETTYEYE